MTRCLWLSLCGLVLATAAPAQPADSLRPDSAGVYAHLEALLDTQTDPTRGSVRAAERLARLAERPLDLNRAPAADLSALPGVSPTLARRVVRHRRDHGGFEAVGDVLAVEGLDRRQLRRLAPYLTAASAPTDRPQSSDGPPLRRLTSSLDARVLQRATRDLDPGRGFGADGTPRTVSGSAVRLTTRLQVNAGRRAEAALTVDKDPGEALRWRPRTGTYGFDHVAGHLSVHDLGPVETLILGTYTAEYGQGLALWQGLSFGKGRDPVSSLVRDGRGLVPFQSTSENRYFRGLAGTVSVTPRLSASAFVSRRRRDATLDSVRAGPAPVVVRSLSTGGLHRTPGERRGRNALGTTTVGGALEYRSARLHLGTVGHWTRLERPLRPPDRPYRRFDLAGRHAGTGSLFAHLFLDPYTLFGAVARSLGGHYGGVVGASMTHDAGVEALVLARRYGRSFRGLHNGGVGESGDTQNEIGFYTGVRLRVTDDWRLSAYVDQYRFPWLRFSVPRPSWGLDTRLVAEYEPRPWLTTELQIRAEREAAGTERRGPGGRRLAGLQTEARQTARWETAYTFREGVTLRTRLQGARSATGATPPAYGVLLAQGLRLRPTESLQFDARLALFDTDDYAARLYAYEHDLLYSFSVPVLYGQGQRSYVLVQYEPTAALTLEAKYGVSWYPHRQTLGSGLRATDGPRRRELRLQVRWSP